MISAKIKEKQLSKYKKTDPLFLHFEGNMHLCVSFYLQLYAIILLKQYLISIYAHVLQNVQLF